LPIGGLAATCNLSRSYFIKAFKKTTGRTPHRWLLQHRIDKAKELLLHSLPIAEISLECGFTDQSHFTCVFTNIMGMPPGVWRLATTVRRSAPGVYANSRGNSGAVNAATDESPS
jgi:AraC-like DNA-binding protein